MQTQLLMRQRPKSAWSKAVQMIAPRPLPSRKTQGHLPGLAAVPTCHVSLDHDYCRPHVPPVLRDVCAEPGHACPDPERGASTWNLNSRVSDSPETGPAGRPHTPTVSTPPGSEEGGPWPLATPPPSPPCRGRDRRRCRRRAHSGSSWSSSSSSSPSGSPKRQRQRPGHFQGVVVVVVVVLCSRLLVSHRLRGKRSASSSSSRSPSGSRSPQRRSRRRRRRSRSTSWSRSRSPAPSKRRARGYR